MRKITLNQIMQEIEEAFPLSDLSLEEFRIASKCYLRFELGRGFENGTPQRVEQATERAASILEAFFEPEDEVWVAAKSWEHKGDGKDLWPGTPGYFEQQFVNFDDLEKPEREVTVEEFGEIENAQGVVELADLTLTHRLTVYCDKLKHIDYRNILLGIANLEMGFTPAISNAIHFINMRTQVAFYMYDDRGCLVFARDCDTLRPAYACFNDWLVDDYRSLFDALFGR